MTQRPHKFPASIPDGEIIAWCCAACRQWVSEYRSSQVDECPVDWRNEQIAPAISTDPKDD